MATVVNETEMPTLLSDEQVAELTGWNRQTLANRRAKRQGPPFLKLGGKTIRYDRAKVIAWLEAQTVQTA